MRTPSSLQPGNAEPLAVETGAGNIFMTSSLRAISVLVLMDTGDFYLFASVNDIALKI